MFFLSVSSLSQLFCSHSGFVSRLMVDVCATENGGGSGGSGTHTHSGSQSSGGGGSVTGGAAVPTHPTIAPSSNPFCVSLYVGVDADPSGPRSKWLLRDAPFPAEWLAADPARADLTAAGDPAVGCGLTPGSFDLAVSFRSLTSKSCGSSASLRRLFRNAASLLRVGGVLAGTCHDAATIWYKINKRERESGGKAQKVDPTAALGVLAFGPGYRIDFPQLPRSRPTFHTGPGEWEWDGSDGGGGGAGNNSGSGSGNGIGSGTGAASNSDPASNPASACGDPHSPALRFWLQVTEPTGAPSAAYPAQPGALLHVGTLVAAARAHGFELLHLTNYADFFAEHGASSPFAQAAQRISVFVKGVPQGQLTSAQADFYSLFAVFAFRKVAEVADTADT